MKKTVCVLLTIVVLMGAFQLPVLAASERKEEVQMSTRICQQVYMSSNSEAGIAYNTLLADESGGFGGEIPTQDMARGASWLLLAAGALLLAAAAILLISRGKHKTKNEK